MQDDELNLMRGALARRLPARYELLEPLGEGGMATVWAARDTTLDGETIALKVLHPHLLEDELVVERFRREVIAARGLIHPHIVRLHDLIEAPGCMAISMRRHAGVDLKHVLRERGKLGWDECVEVVVALLSALECAHEAGVIHRDIKPQNIMVNPEDLSNVQLMDFGLARVDALIGITTHTTTLGSVDYMAPEQLHAMTLDARADLYAVGVVCYELLTGERPYHGATPLQLARAHAEHAIPSACERVEALPGFADAFLAIALAKRPEDRFATAGEMRKTLSGALPLFRTMSQRQVWPCTRCDTPLVAAWAPCLACGETTRVTARAGKARVYLPAAPMFREGSVKLGRKDVLSEQQKHKVVQMLGDVRWGLEQRSPNHVQLLRLKSLPVVLTEKIDVESATQMAWYLRDIGIPAHYTDGTPGRTFTFWRRILLNRKIIPFAGISTLLYPCMGCLSVLGLLGVVALMKSILSLQMDAVSDAWFGMSFLVGPVIMLSMVYMVFFLYTARHMATFKAVTAVDERATWLPEDATALYGTLKLEHTRALYRGCLSRSVELRELLGRQDAVPMALLENVSRLPGVMGEQIRRIDRLEREIHASSPQDIHAAMTRARDLEAQHEHPEQVAKAMRALVQARARLEALDRAHSELAKAHQQMLELEHQLATMISQLRRGVTSAEEHAHLERTVLDFEKLATSSTQSEAQHATQVAHTRA